MHDVEMMFIRCSIGIAALVLLMGCGRTTERRGAKPVPLGDAVSSSQPKRRAAPGRASASAAPSASVAKRRSVKTAAYPWHQDDTLEVLGAVEHLADRFAPPSGFTRVPVEPASFGAWLRQLPLAATGTPVRSYAGRLLLEPDHANLAAVVTVDVGKADLQQCVDAVVRLHAEWMWSRGRRDMSYRAASGTNLPYSRWASGERVIPKGKGIRWEPKGRPGESHASFRKYLDAVFSWANTVSVERQAAKVTLEDVRPGDFMVLPGNPGHAVLVLDLARASDGRRVALLGQSFMPAQNFHVLRPGPNQIWFPLDPAAAGVKTPFWPLFPWSALRRLDP